MTREMIYLGDYQAMTRTIFGHKMVVDTRDMAVGQCILMDGQWETWTAHVLRRFLAEGMVMVDIGAHIGYFTVLAAAAVGATGRVYAFEPSPTSFPLLCRNVHINGFRGRVRPVRKAVLDRSGSVTFSDLRHFQGGSQVGQFLSRDQLEELQDEARIVQVECTRLDDYLATQDCTRVDVVKMDVQGAEPFVFRGMTGTLRDNPHIVLIVEFAPACLRGLGHDPQRFLADLEQLGFPLRYIHPPDASLRLASPDELLAMENVELLLTRRF